MLAAVGGTKGVATGTFENELALVPKTGIAFSTSTAVSLKIGDSERSRYLVSQKSCGLSNMQPADIAGRNFPKRCVCNLLSR